MVAGSRKIHEELLYFVSKLSSPAARAANIAMNKKIIYVAASVTHASPRYRAFIADFKQGLKSSTDAMILEWVDKDLHVNISDFYLADMNNVRGCDGMIALADEPSTGLGMEICEAVWHNKPLLCLHEKQVTVSRLLVGARDSIGLRLVPYQDLSEAIDIASDFIKALSDQPARDATY